MRRAQQHPASRWDEGTAQHRGQQLRRAPGAQQRSSAPPQQTNPRLQQSLLAGSSACLSTAPTKTRSLLPSIQRLQLPMSLCLPSSPLNKKIKRSAGLQLPPAIPNCTCAEGSAKCSSAALLPAARSDVSPAFCREGSGATCLSQGWIPAAARLLFSMPVHVLRPELRQSRAGGFSALHQLEIHRDPLVPSSKQTLAKFKCWYQENNQLWQGQRCNTQSKLTDKDYAEGKKKKQKTKLRS